MLALALSALSTGAVAQFNLNLNRLIDTGKNIVDATKDVNEKQEADIGGEYAAVLVGAAPLLANTEVERYVNRVGRWLSLNSERPGLNWQFGVLDTGNVNAFSTPGGYVLITRGLLERLKNEAELAGVLAHEVAHVVKKHHLTAMRKGKGVEAGANVLSMYLDQQRSAAAKERLVGGIKEVMLRGLDKDDEFEADRMAVVIAARAGYDPFGLPSVVQMLQGLNPKDSELSLMFATHPDPGSRLDALDRAMGTLLDKFAKQPQAAERYARSMQGK
ncbi:MAG TPA: M48 family metalloprotease [Burkholderiales bacterium]|jgi:predicted Zn-dependent protease|nr:M48 family metalloprotease [Burkholderiales bacterium]